MFEAFGRSWHLTKMSFQVLTQDKEMLLFPLLGGIFSILYTLAILYPTIIAGVLAGNDASVTALEYVLLFIVYLGLAFIATFFNVCVVYTTKTRFEGGDATFMDSIKFALSKIGLIFAWAMVSATVGMILRGIDHLAAKIGGVGEILLNILRSLLGLAWSVITVFVIPAMVYRDLGPIAAIRASVSALKETWGESLIRHYGLGLAQTICMFSGALLFGLLLFATASSSTAFVIVLIFAIIYFILVVLAFNVLNSVFNTALFVYANSGETPGGFEQETMAGAIGSKG